ncbi:BQ5605_C009g05471 [Microbotryum silenes-dioicae]|uniref:BQ5605_C009g05471 protein n=1 Tax=Microbotryum silenes-dioicae TaxID=796604 RepID=A0A2X0MHB9_9BASI|nr:BQ5605_C009g05471 [Microbotryum silenes-dioicae]
MYSTQKLPLSPRHSVMSHAQLGETRCSDEPRAPLSSASTSQHNRQLPDHSDASESTHLRRVSRVTRLSGRFCSPVIYCTEANGYLSTFLARLLSLSDRELGVISSLFDRAGPASFSFASSELPSRVPCFQKHFSGSPRLEDIRIFETLFQSNSIFGRHTSAFRVSAGREGSTALTEYAMTVSFVEESRCDEHDRIRLTIANASPDDRQGLTHIVDVYRESDFVVVPRFFPDTLDASEWGLKPRALEVTFHEQCFEPICVVDSTEALARVILGAVQDSLYRLRILHRDVSAPNVMVTSDGNGVLIDYDTAVFMDGPEGEAERKKNAGTLTFRARELVKEYEGRPPFFHEPWHDIESLVYVIMYTVLIMPSGPDDSSELSEDLFLAPWGAKQWFEPFKEFWKEDLRALVQTVAKYCGLGVQRRLWAAEVDEAAVLEPRWASGELSHRQLASDLHALIARDRALLMVQGDTCWSSGPQKGSETGSDSGAVRYRQLEQQHPHLGASNVSVSAESAFKVGS